PRCERQLSSFMRIVGSFASVRRTASSSVIRSPGNVMAVGCHSAGAGGTGGACLCAAAGSAARTKTGTRRPRAGNFIDPPLARGRDSLVGSRELTRGTPGVKESASRAERLRGPFRLAVERGDRGAPLFQEAGHPRMDERHGERQLLE